MCSAERSSSTKTAAAGATAGPFLPEGKGVSHGEFRSAKLRSAN
jgi:hypothetical protein